MNLSILELGGPTMTVRRRNAFCLTSCDLPNTRPLPPFGTLSVAFSDTPIFPQSAPNLYCMPPTPAYNWFCVLYGAAEVLSHAAQYRAGQLASTRSAVAVARNRKGRTQETPRRAETREDTAFEAPRLPVLEGRQEKPTPIASLDLTPLETPQLKNHVEHDPLPPMPKSHVEPDLFLPLNDPSPTVSPIPPVEVVLESIPSAVERPSIEGISDSLQNPQSPVQELPFQTQTRTLKSSKVPSSRIGRLFHYGGTGALCLTMRI